MTAHRFPHPSAPITIGFTGTRVGMTAAQKATVRDLLGQLYPIGKLHHGMCVGADAEMHAIMREYDPDITIEGWPGRSALVVDGTDDARAEVVVDVTREPMTHFARNRGIVGACDFLIAAPFDATEQTKGGTWYTVNYARKVGRDGTIVWPDGRSEALATAS